MELQCYLTCKIKFCDLNVLKTIRRSRVDTCLTFVGLYSDKSCHMIRHVTAFHQKSAFLSIAVSLNTSLDMTKGLIHIIKNYSNEFGSILFHFTKKHSFH